MAAIWAAGPGFWMPLNMMAAVFEGFRPPQPGFQPGATLTGLMVHMATSAFYGAVVAIALGVYLRRRATAGSALGLGIGLGVVAWLIGITLGVAVNPVLAQAPGLIFFLGHIVFGITTVPLAWAWLVAARRAQLPAADTGAGRRRGEALRERRSSARGTVLGVTIALMVLLLLSVLIL